MLINFSFNYLFANSFIRISAVPMLVATGTLWTSQILINAETSGSCGWAVKGSLKKITKSMSPSAKLPPICWSPPYGPDKYLWTFNPVASLIFNPVVPVDTS